jgi:hypothetical protein
MDAYAFALTLGTAGLAAMTVLGFHHGHAPGPSGHGQHHSTHIRGADRAGAHRRSFPPAWDGRRAIERFD